MSAGVTILSSHRYWPAHRVFGTVTDPLFCGLFSLFPPEVNELASHGIAKPTEAVGLTDEQILELKIQDLWTPKCFPSGGSDFTKDVIGRRTGNGENTERENTERERAVSVFRIALGSLD